MDNELPDLETVGKLALAWNDLIKSIAAEVDPTLTVRVDFVGTEEGSLWLKNLIEGIKTGDPKSLTAVIGGVLLFFAMGPALHLQEDFGDWFWEQFGHIHTEEERAEVTERAQGAALAVAEKEGGRLIIEASRDKAIDGVGAWPVPIRGKPPIHISRADFPAYLPPTPLILTTTDKKTDVVPSLRVYAIKPNLREGVRKPRWRFQDEDGREFSADIEDEEFIEALRERRTGIELGIRPEFRVVLAIDRIRVGAAWEVKNNRVLRVTYPPIVRRPTSFLPPD